MTATSGDNGNPRCAVQMGEAEAGNLVLRRLDNGEASSFGVEAFGLDTEACQTATRTTAMPATPACSGIFPWIEGDVDHRRQVLGAAGAHLVASANVDGRLHQVLVKFDKTAPALARLSDFASQCGGREDATTNSIRRWRIAADAERETWMLMSGGTVLYLRFDMKIGDGFTSRQVRQVADDAMRVTAS